MPVSNISITCKASRRFLLSSADSAAAAAAAAHMLPDHLLPVALHAHAGHAAAGAFHAGAGEGGSHQPQRLLMQADTQGQALQGSQAPAGAQAQQSTAPAPDQSPTSGATPAAAAASPPAPAPPSIQQPSCEVAAAFEATILLDPGVDADAVQVALRQLLAKAVTGECAAAVAAPVITQGIQVCVCVCFWGRRRAGSWVGSALVHAPYLDVCRSQVQQPLVEPGI